MATVSRLAALSFSYCYAWLLGLLLTNLIAGPLAAQRLVSPQREEQLRALLPNLDNDEDHERLHNDPSVVFYTIREMPAAYQFAAGNGGIRTGFLTPNFNVSGDNNPPFFSSSRPHGRGGNANIDLPWKQDVPGGTHRSRTVDSFKAFWLPKQDNGRPWPVVWFHQRLRNPISAAGFDPAYGWIFPTGTVFYEIITLKSPGGYDFTFEVRKREREPTDWGVDIFRPFPTAESMAEAVRREENWDSDQELVRLVNHLESPRTVETRRFVDKINRSQQAINVVQGYDPLPAIRDRDLIARLLTQTTFQSSLGETWKDGTGSSPETYTAGLEREEFHIVPPGYDGTFLGTDRISCISCHESTNVHARVFDRGRGWYGYVRGSDGILSWHPIEPRSIRTSTPGRVVFRESFARAGIIERFNRQQHPSDIYQRINGLK